jgi:hypothetical protein
MESKAVTTDLPPRDITLSAIRSRLAGSLSSLTSHSLSHTHSLSLSPPPLQQLTLTDAQREALSASSAFRSFVIQTSQLQVALSYSISLTDTHSLSLLQLVDLLSLDDNSRVVFFSNIFNVIVVHAIILRGYTGTGFYDKCTFMRIAKYNINGHIFNLLEVCPLPIPLLLCSAMLPALS